MRQLILVSAAAILLTACDQATHDIRFVTPTEFVDRSIVEELGTVFDENSSINAIVLPEPMAEKEALDRVASGEADIALVSNYLPFRDDVATVMPLYPTGGIRKSWCMPQKESKYSPFPWGKVRLFHRMETGWQQCIPYLPGRS